MGIISDIEKKHLRKEIPPFSVGDAVEVHVLISEGEKERVQIYAGTVISRKGSGMREMFTVRRIVQGEGVERTWPLHSPKIAKVVVTKAGKVRRAKLFYLRDRTGKSVRIEESVEETVRIKKEARDREAERAKTAPAPKPEGAAEKPAHKKAGGKK
jgi:large subunit ribosomal protein L19